MALWSLYSTKTIRFKEYKYLFNHLGKWFTFSYSPSLYILILRASITQQQEEQTYLFLKFKVFSFIYYPFSFTVTEFIVGGSLNPTDRDCFIGTSTSSIDFILLRAKDNEILI
jgi:hypothetical protein